MKIVVIIFVVVGLLFFVGLPLFVLFYLFIGQPNEVKGISMTPAYTEGEYIFVNKIAVRNRDFERGQVVTYVMPNKPNFDGIKRIVGLPGETIKISGGKVYINNTVLNESSYLSPGTETGPEAFLEENKEFKIPSNSIFALGDNRPHASDSRETGPIPEKNIIGKVEFCYWNCK